MTTHSTVTWPEQQWRSWVFQFRASVWVLKIRTRVCQTRILSVTWSINRRHVTTAAAAAAAVKRRPPDPSGSRWRHVDIATVHQTTRSTTHLLTSLLAAANSHHVVVVVVGGPSCPETTHGVHGCQMPPTYGSTSLPDHKRCYIKSRLASDARTHTRGKQQTVGGTNYASHVAWQGSTSVHHGVYSRQSSVCPSSSSSVLGYGVMTDAN